MADLTQIAENVIRGQAPKVQELVSNALAEEVPASDILHDGLIQGMSIVGERFKNNEFHIPEVLIAARAMKMGMGLLRPHLADAGVEPLGKIAVGEILKHSRGGRKGNRRPDA